MSKCTLNYTITVKPLSEDDGGGFLAEFPDLAGCIVDGATVEEAISEAADALESWLKTAKTQRPNSRPL